MRLVTKISKIITSISSLAISLAVSPLAVMAADIDLSAIDTGQFPITGFTASGLVASILTAILVIAALVAFLFLLIGGTQLVLAGGDKEGTEKARKRITNALIGLAIVFSAYAITTLIKSMFGVNILQLTFKPVV